MVYYLTRFASWLAGRVPRPARLAVAGPATVLVYYLWAAKRRVTIANMAHILGVPERDARARQLARLSWRNYGRYVSDFFYLPNATPSEMRTRLRDVSPEPGAFALIDEGLARGRGILLVSAHFGAWDVAGVFAAMHTPIYLLVETFDDPRMDRLVQEQRRGLGMDVLRIEKTPRHILRVLQGNGVIGVAVDRPVGRDEGVPISFFGRQCYVPGGIAQLALKSGAALLPGFCWYDDAYSRAYYVSAGPLIIPESSGDKRADTIALTQRMFDALESEIRRRPEQWAMFRRFWPEGEDAEEQAREIASAPAEQVTVGEISGRE